MSAFDAVIGENHWGNGKTAEEAADAAFCRWCEEDDSWWDSDGGFQVEVYEGALFESSNDPDHENGFMLARWTRRGTAAIVAGDDDQPVLCAIVWDKP